MRGPMDEIDQPEPQSSATGSRTGRVRPPGGKALARLVQELASHGFLDDAQVVATLALPELEESAARELVARVAGPRPGTPEEGYGDGLQRLGEAYLATAEDLAATPPTPAGPNWRSLGPWTIPNGQTYGASRVNVSGRVSAIAVDPTNVNHLLVGAANGGVWESRDRGASWSPRTDDAATLTVGAIAFHPSTPATVLAGMGEGNWWS